MDLGVRAELPAVQRAELVALEPGSEPSSQPSSQPSTEPQRRSRSTSTVNSPLEAGRTADLGSITESTSAQVVTLASIKANGNTKALENALKKNETAVAKLRTNVAANAVLAAKLTAANYTADQVIAVLEVDGSIIVVVDA